MHTNPPQTLAEEVAATLEADNKWEALSLQARATYLAHIEECIDDFIGIVQGGPDKRCQITRYLFCAINELFKPNTKDNTAQEETIFLKNLRKGDATWIT